MKRIILSILAVAALASCSKTESAYVDQDQEIKLNPVTAMATKAYAPVYGAIDGTTYPTTENFDVRAYWANKPAGEKFTEGETIYLGTAEAAVPFTNKGKYWGGTTTYYWPKNGSLRFAAYSPATLNMAHEFATDTYTLEHSQAYNTANTIDMLIAPMTPSYNAETATENVSVVFEHALSWITVKVKAANPEAAKAFKVHDVIVNDVFTKATLTAAMTDGIQYAEWGEETAKSAPQDYEVYTNAYPNGQDVTVNSTTIESKNAEGEYRDGTIVIPQVPTTLTINYTQKAMEGTPELQNQSVTVPLELDVEGAVWEPGKHYIYTVIFDLDEILINPSVADWEDVVVDDKNMDDAGQIATVKNEEELIAALAAEVKEIELTSEIALTSQLAVNYSVAFVGGGFTGKPIVVTGPVVSFEGVAFANATSGTETSVYVYDGNTNITFQNCTFDSYAYEAIQYTSDDALWVCVDGCTFNAAAHRDLHLEVDNPSKAEVKITNNQFNGTDADSYVTVYGFDYERMILADNVTEENPTTVNVWISDVFDWNYLTLDGFVKPSDEVNTATATILNSDVETATNINIAGNYLDGKGHTVKATAGGVWAINATGGNYIENLYVNGNGYKSVRGIMLRGNDGNVVLNNVHISNVLYPLNTSFTTTEKKNKIIVVNSTLRGWTSFDGFASAEFKDTYFGFGDYGHVKPYITTVFENCVFEKGVTIDFEVIGSNSITFKNCKVDGVVLTAENVATYLNCCDFADATNPWGQATFTE